MKERILGSFFFKLKLFRIVSNNEKSAVSEILNSWIRILVDLIPWSLQRLFWELKQENTRGRNNNSIDKKAISVLEDLQMNYSGIIGVRDRKVNLRYI